MDIVTENKYTMNKCSWAVKVPKRSNEFWTGVTTHDDKNIDTKCVTAGELSDIPGLSHGM